MTVPLLAQLGSVVGSVAWGTVMVKVIVVAVYASLTSEMQMSGVDEVGVGHAVVAV